MLSPATCKPKCVWITFSQSGRAFLYKVAHAQRRVGTVLGKDLRLFRERCQTEIIITNFFLEMKVTSFTQKCNHRFPKAPEFTRNFYLYSSFKEDLKKTSEFIVIANMRYAKPASTLNKQYQKSTSNQSNGQRSTELV